MTGVADVIANSVTLTSFGNPPVVGTPSVVRPTLTLAGILAGITAVPVFAVAGTVDKIGTLDVSTSGAAASGVTPGDNSLPTLDIITAVICI